jgi:putative tryptophan/tyrosine transport system substrate-binding protein
VKDAPSPRCRRRLILWAVIVVLFQAEIVSAQDLIITVKSLEAEPYNVAYGGVREALARTGREVAIQEYVLGEGRGARERILSQIRDRRPTLILTLGSTATAFARGHVPDVPVVFCMVLNPVAGGLIPSMQSSGANLTGVSLDIPPRLQFEAFKSVVPSIRRVGVLYNPRDTGEVVQSAERAAREMGLELVLVPVTSAEKLQDGARALDAKIDALWAVADSTVFSSERSTEFLLRKTIEQKLPFMGLSPAFVKAGALLALGVDYKDVGLQCGEVATQVLGGQAPSSIPIAVPRKVTLYLNATVAKAIGVSIPRDVMERAVILK